MRIFVVGCGSIGKRHIGNLKRLSLSEITAFDPRSERREETEEKYGIKVYEKFEDGLSNNPDAVVIASPTSLHLEQAKVAGLKGCHIFIEKPISHNMDGVDEFIEVVDGNKLIVLIGYNMRYHPCLKRIKEILSKGEIGRVISARVQCGQYLPDWHPSEDYRKGYSARSELGGGVILDASHELDYIRWFLGEAKEVFAFAGKLSSLEIDTEDTAEILIKFDSGAIGEVHLDYIQRTKSRACQIIGEEGTIIWDINEECVKLFKAESGKWEIYPQKKDFDVNNMYTDEMKYFIECIEKGERVYPDARDGKKVLEIAVSAKQSSLNKELIKIS